MAEKSLDSVKHEDSARKCPDCGADLNYKNGELFCKKCGLVVE